MRVWRVPELQHEGVTFEGGLHDTALHPRAATVHQTNLPEACLVGGSDVFLDHGLHVAWLEGVEIERGLDRESNGILHLSARVRTGQ